MKNILITITILLMFFSLNHSAFCASITVGRILIHGPVGFSPDQFRDLLKIREGNKYSELELNNELKRLFGLGKFRNIIFEPIKSSETQKDLKIIVDPKLTIDEVSFKGNYLFTTAELEDMGGLTKGTEWSQETVEFAPKNIISAYKEHGYHQTLITSSTTEGTNPLTVDISFKIDEGEPATIDRIEIVGVPKDFARRLTKNLDLDEDDLFNELDFRTKLKELQRSLYEEKYLDAEIDDPTIRFFARSTRVAIRIPIHLGPKYEFYFKGNEFLSTRKLLRLARPYKEEFFGPSSAEDIMSSISREYRLLGFYFADITYTIEQEQNRSLKRIQFLINEGPRVKISEFTFPNTKHYSKAFYSDYLYDHSSKILKHGYLNTPDIEIAIDSLENFLHSEGFLFAQAEDFKLRFSEDQSSVSVQVNIDEGVQTLIGSIEFSGNIHLKNENLLKISGLELNSPLTYYHVGQAERAIIRHYQNQGHYYAQIQETEEIPRIRFQDGNEIADIHFNVIENRQIRIGSIYIRGQEQTKEQVIRRELTIKPGDLLTPKVVRESESRIARTGLFQSVVIRPLNPSPESAVKRMLVLVKERNPGLVEFGVGIASDDGLRGFGGIAYRNVMGWNRTASARIQLNQPLGPDEILEGNANLGFVEPYLLGIPFIFRTNLIYLKERTLTYDEKRYETLLTLEKDFSKHVRGKFHYSFRSRDITPRGTEGETEKDELLALIGPTIILDFRNDPFNPTKGHHHTIRLDYSEPALGGETDIRFYRLTSSSSYYFPLSSWLVFAASLNSGYLESLTDRDVPIDQRFLLGGRKSIRGFKEQSLGIVPMETIVLESYYINPRAELRFPIWKSLWGATFFDAGNVFFPNGPDRSMRYSAGTSIRYKTPIGPLSLDLGFNLDPKPEEDDWRVHFSIGTF
ncbi:outer membrane protein assembly factor BamA [Bdellovibrionota bacterium]